MPVDITEVLAKAKAPERTVDLCLQADLAAEHDELNRQLVEAQRAGVTTMADTGRTAELAQRIRDLEEQMRASTVTFRVRGLSPYEREQWLADHPGRDGKSELFNPLTGLAPLLAACAVDPAMTADQAQELCQKLGSGQTDKLFAAAWEATHGGGQVPFSVAASATLRAHEQKQQ